MGISVAYVFEEIVHDPPFGQKISFDVKNRKTWFGPHFVKTWPENICPFMKS